MFFEKEYTSFEIIDVVHITQEKCTTKVHDRNFCAISYRLKSRAVLTTDSQSITAKDGSVCFMPPKIVYTRTSEYDDLIAVHIRTNLTEKSLEIEHFTTKNPEIYTELFLKIFELWTSKCFGYKYKCAALFNEILAECCRENYTEKSERDQINSSLQYLHEHFNDATLTVGELAARSFMSEVYFRRLFKKLFGISPTKYIINMRIAHAAVLMSSGFYSLKEVALLSGYTDYHYFSSEFKRIKGVAPSEYLYNY